MSVRLENDLNLTPLQQAFVKGILEEREAEIRGCHDAIRKSGVLDTRHYELQVSRMKGAWYRTIDALLDGSQHERFVALVDQGFLNEGLAFSIEPEMMLLE
jgi:hypothetical protein